MELKDALLKRRSVRSFSEDSVNKDDIDYLLHAAMSGPSAVNMRPWEFYVVTKKEAIEALNKVGYAKYKAPLAIVVAGNAKYFLPGENSTYWVQDTSAATENILLAATDRGLGACWCGVYPSSERQKQVSKILNLPNGILPLNIVLIGHPNARVPEARDQFDDKKVHLV
jgi:nitroreductase